MWSPPSYEKQNGIIIGYVINVTMQETGELFQFISFATYLEVTSLKPFRTYICTIAAMTSVGLGTFSTSVTVNTLEVCKCTYSVFT